MAPQSRILTALARARFQQSAVRQIRDAGRKHYTTTGRQAASPTWDSPLRRVTGTLMMFVPVAALTMFWPVAVWPAMNWYEERS